jgi:8-amino-7-oxononanoate synthase
MKKFPQNLRQKLDERIQNQALRTLGLSISDQVDFSSNDYLGFSKNPDLFQQTHTFLQAEGFTTNGATGSRLLSGNHPLYERTEKFIATFHDTESALIFNSGYDANVGFFSCVPQRGDVILFDELCHASMRDGIRLSHAKSYKFAHNDYEDLEKQLNIYSENANVYIATESVFSMDGDAPNLELLSQLAQKHHAYLVLDEAHALGVFGEKGEGLAQSQLLHHEVFARIVTFGKGLGCHGAAVLGSSELKDYLVNFARSFIYTTGLSPHSIASILIAYEHLATQPQALAELHQNIVFFNQYKMQLGLKPMFVYSKSAIQCAIIPGNQKVKSIAAQLQEKGFDVKPILSPTVPEGQERLRICLHNFNSQEQIRALLDLILQAL